MEGLLSKGPTPSSLVKPSLQDIEGGLSSWLTDFGQICCFLMTWETGNAGSRDPKAQNAAKQMEGNLEQKA